MNRPLCACGCGQLTPLASRTDPRLGHVKGQPTRFVFRHRILPPRTPTLELTDAQLEALRLAACGLTSKQIAERLGITEQAAHLRLKAAGHNLGARNRTHAVAIALRLKLIRLDEVEMGREAAQTPASRPEKPQRPGSRPEPPTGRQTPAQPIRDERNAA